MFAVLSSVAANYLLVLFSYEVQAAQKQDSSNGLTPVSRQTKASQTIKKRLFLKNYIGLVISK